MSERRNWLGWLGLGLGAIALLIALSGWSFGSVFPGGAGSAAAPPAYAQQGGQNQSSVPQDGSFTPNARGVPGRGQQQSDARRAGRQPSGGMWDVGRWFGFPFKLLDGLRNAAILALLLVLGVWLLRGRGVQRNPAAQGAQGSAPEQRSPTGESYVDESGNSTE